MNILVVEDEVVVADHLCDCLVSQGFTCADPALNYRMAVSTLESTEIDLAIIDIHLGGALTGIDIARYINESKRMPFLFLTVYADSATITEAKETFPSGYLIKPYKPIELKPAIEIAYNNFYRKDGEESEDEILRLSASERKIVQLIAQNQPSRIIADSLSVSLSTIKNHRHNICEKLGLPSTNNSLLAWALTRKDKL